MRINIKLCAVFYHLVDDAVFKSLGRREEVVAIRIALDHLQGLSRVLC